MEEALRHTVRDGSLAMSQDGDGPLARASPALMSDRHSQPTKDWTCSCMAVPPVRLFAGGGHWLAIANWGDAGTIRKACHPLHIVFAVQGAA